MRVVAAAGVLLLSSTVAGSWSVGTPLPEQLQEHHGALYRGQIYVAGGIDSTNETTKVAYRLDLRRNAWERIADLPEPRHHMPLVVLNDTLYAIGGFDGLRFTPKATVWIYRADRNTWEARAPMPTKRDHLEAQVVNDVLYAIGGRPISPGSNYDVVEAYDLAHDRWTTKAPMPSKRGGLASAVLNGRIHTFGGERNDAVYENHEVYDPTRDAWIVEAPMPTPRHGLAAVTASGKIYVIGGGPRQGLAQTAAVEVWQP